MSADDVDKAVYPRAPVIAHRTPARPSVPEGWSIQGRTWFTDAQIETEFVPAEVVERLLEAAQGVWAECEHASGHCLDCHERCSEQALCFACELRAAWAAYEGTP